MAAIASAVIAGGAGIASGLLAGRDRSASISSDVAPASDFEKRMAAQSERDYGDLRSFLGTMGDSGSAKAYGESQQGLSEALQAAYEGRGLPNAEDVTAANDYASKVFAPEATRQSQQFQDQYKESQRASARMGRSGADPILQAKLRQEQTRQAADLSARQGAYGAETAMNLPERRLNLLERKNAVLGNVFEQAKRNREYLANIGRQLSESDRKFRQDIATKTKSEPGGGFDVGAAVGTAGATFGTGASIASKFGSTNKPSYDFMNADYGSSRGTVENYDPYSNYSGKGAGPLNPSYSQYPGYGVYKVNR